jgi:hypothetical protein
MFRLTAKYYLEDNLDRDERYNVFRTRALAFLNERAGIAARFEHMEHAVTENTSVLVGPAVVF